MIRFRFWRERTVDSIWYILEQIEKVRERSSGAIAIIL